MEEDFNPPSPCGEGRRRIQPARFTPPTSIHPPRVGRDRPPGWSRDQRGQISIHPPRVGRDRSCAAGPTARRKFQSTLPVWGGTTSTYGTLSLSIFQSTLPVWGGTLGRNARGTHTADFNPPSPCGEGRLLGTDHYCAGKISIHPPRVGRDLSRRLVHPVRQGISIHPPRVGRDSERVQKVVLYLYTLNKFSHIFPYRILFPGRESGSRRHLFSKSKCEGPRENLGASSSHPARPAGRRRDRSRVSYHNG